MPSGSASWEARSCAPPLPCRRRCAHAFPQIPIIWGGHFPTICAAACLAEAVCRLRHPRTGRGHLRRTARCAFRKRHGRRCRPSPGLSWRARGQIIHNPNRPFSAAGLARDLPFERLGNPRRYLGRTYLGQRTAGYQAALGCRFRCTFCGVAAMFRGTHGAAAAAAAGAGSALPDATNWASTPCSSTITTSSTAKRTRCRCWRCWRKYQLPWWCFARSDALLNLSARAWALVRKSRLRMAYIGAESPSDWLLHDIRKGTSTDQTLEAVEKCRSNGVIPELSFMLAPPQDPEGETERTFEFIRQIKRVHPRTEIMLYIYAPLPTGPGQQQSPRGTLGREFARRRTAQPLQFPATATAMGRTIVGRVLVPHRHPVDHARSCGGGSRISPPCSAAVFPPLPMCARRCGASPH